MDSKWNEGWVSKSSGPRITLSHLNSCRIPVTRCRRILLGSQVPTGRILLIPSLMDSILYLVTDECSPLCRPSIWGLCDAIDWNPHVTSQYYIYSSLTKKTIEYTIWEWFPHLLFWVVILVVHGWRNIICCCGCNTDCCRYPISI